MRANWIFPLIAVLCLAANSVRAQEASVEVLGLEQLPPDMTLVIGQIATILQGRGPDEALPVFLTEEALSGLTMHGTLDYSEFAVAGAAVLESALVESEPARMRADFTLMLMDGLLRRASVGVVTEYVIHPSGVLIESAKSAPVFPASPEAELHFVPRDRVPEDLLDRLAGHDALLDWVRRNGASPEEGSSYYVFACLTEEVEQDAVLSLLLSSDREGVQGRYMPVETLYDGGWLVAVGMIDLSGSNSGSQYVKLIFGGGGHKPKELRHPRLVGSFSLGR